MAEAAPWFEQCQAEHNSSTGTSLKLVFILILPQKSLLAADGSFVLVPPSPASDASMFCPCADSQPGADGLLQIMNCKLVIFVILL